MKDIFNAIKFGHIGQIIREDWAKPFAEYFEKKEVKGSLPDEGIYSKYEAYLKVGIIFECYAKDYETVKEKAARVLVRDLHSETLRFLQLIEEATLHKDQQRILQLTHTLKEILTGEKII